MLVFQIFINIGMTIGVAPITGIPLPFMSFGGTHTITNLFAIGVLVLTFVPLAVTPAATGFCNALLAGWLVAFAIERIAARFVFRPRIVEAIPARA